MGTLYGIGVGPGDPEYMTLKAVRNITKSDILLLPNKCKDDCYAYKIAKQMIPGIDEKIILCRDFPMIKDGEQLKILHDQIYEEVKGYLVDKDVAFLTIGDPSIYSTYNYIHKRVVEGGGKAQMISGVTSFCGVAARLGIPLAENKEPIYIIPGSYNMNGELDICFSGTYVYMKSGKKLDELIAYLEIQSEKHELQVWGVSNCGLPGEQVYRGLQELKQKHTNAYLTIVIVKR